MTSNALGEPIRILIAAMGGEGGGVLAGWITEAAIAAGLLASRTSIPGVAQRTGATTYYLEVRQAADGRRPVLALNPAPGEVDVVIATELLEAARMVESGYVTPDRTLLIAPVRRVYTIDEKSAMRDGRLPPERLRDLVQQHAKEVFLFELSGPAARTGPLNAMLLGVLAGRSVLPIDAETFRTAIRAEGKSIQANLRGFEAGLAAQAAPARRTAETTPPARAAGQSRDLSDFPSEARPVLAEACARLADYQDQAYVKRYLQRVRRFVGRPGANGAFIRDLARHLAVRMSFEDVMRVAQLKVREARIVRVLSEGQPRARDIVDVTEFMSPGPEEIFGLLTPRLGRWALGRVAAHGWANGSWQLKIRTTRFSGFVRLKLLAALRRWRPHTLRFAEEDAWIERWLGLVERTLAVDAAAAHEVVETASLVRGYSDTYKRGLANWTRIATGVIEPMLDGRLARHNFADAVLQARLAATKDPEGEALKELLAAIAAHAVDRQLAAQ
jgi:indolepyruvate ferredoxin oxidoreductase beta subunit